MGSRGSGSGKSSKSGAGGQAISKQEAQEAIDKYVEMSNRIITSDPESAQVLDELISSEGTISGNVTLYRSMSVQELGVQKMKNLRENPEQIVGKVITPGGFISTAKTEEGTLGFGSGPSVTVKFTKVSKTNKGLDLSKLSKRSNEQEVLFNRGSSYKITKSKVLRDKDGDFMGFEIHGEML